MARFLGFGALGFERVGAIADLLQRRDHLVGADLVLAPVDREPPVGEIEPRLDDAGKLLQAAFDLADAGRAADAFDREVHMRGAVMALHEQREIERLGHGDASVQDDAIARAEQALAVARQFDDDVPLARRWRAAVPRKRPEVSSFSDHHLIGAPVGRVGEARDRLQAGEWPAFGVARVDVDQCPATHRLDPGLHLPAQFVLRVRGGGFARDSARPA